MDSFEFSYYGNDIVTYNKTLFTEFSLKLFNPDYLTSNHSLEYKQLKSVDVKGRGGVHVFKYNEHDLVLRHYYRGGIISKFTDDMYLWQGLYRTRAIGEIQMLSRMQDMNLPAPIPIAAHIHRIGFAYKADIITQLIPQSQSLSAVLIKKPVPNKIWHEIGSVIRKFHDNNCNHADLNAHNILLDEKGGVFLIDFDKSRIDNNSDTWLQSNLSRLERSLEKLKKTEATFNYSEQDFKLLMEGYSCH